MTHGDTTHVKTCPDGENSSLLVAITRAFEAAGVERWRSPDWRGYGEGGGEGEGEGGGEGEGEAVGGHDEL